MPWTYLPDYDTTSLPLWTAWRRSITNATYGKKVRYVFVVHFHPHLIDTTGGLRVQLPRDPGVVDTINFPRVIIQYSGLQAGFTKVPDTAWYASRPIDRRARAWGGLVVATQPEHSNNGMVFRKLYRSYIDGAPEEYHVYDLPKIFGDDRLAVFVQWEDPYSHPPVKPTGTSDLAVSLQRAPWPNPLPIGAMLHYAAPEPWAGTTGEASVVDAAGRTVYREQVRFDLGGEDVLGAEAIVELASGVYRLLLRKGGGQEVAVASFVVE